MKRFYTVVVVSVMAGSVFAQDVDLFQGTIGGQEACGLTIDQATYLLGRPDAVEEAPFEEIAAIIGPKLYYEDEGIVLAFKGPEIDPGETLASASFYLTEAVDDSTSRLFQPFAGKLTPAVNPDMKVDDTEAVLKETGFYSETVSPEETQASVEEATGEPAEGPYSWRVQAQNGDVVSNYLHEGVTKFLENVNFVCED